MAYRARTYRRSTRPYRRRTRTTRARRGPIRRRRIIRRRRPTATRRRILNVASVKKQDNRKGQYNINRNTIPLDNLPFTVEGQVDLFVCYCPTYMEPVSLGQKVVDSFRSSEEIFFRGVKETLCFENNSGTPVQWRRIVFSTTDVGLRNAAIPTKLFNYNADWGFTRPFSQCNDDLRTYLTVRLFKGTETADWTDFWTAKIDTSRYNIISDTTRIVASGNDRPGVKTYNLWHPINKKIIYNGDENGVIETESGWSAQSRSSFGDVYIVDFLFSSEFTETGNRFRPTIQSTNYWHER